MSDDNRLARYPKVDERCPYPEVKCHNMTASGICHRFFSTSKCPEQERRIGHIFDGLFKEEDPE